MAFVGDGNLKKVIAVSFISCIMAPKKSQNYQKVPPLGFHVVSYLFQKYLNFRLVKRDQHCKYSRVSNSRVPDNENDSGK